MKWLAVLLSVLACGGCRDGSAPVSLRRTAPAIRERVANTPAAQPQNPAAKRKFRDAVVYLDGRAVGVVKHSELPPTVEPKLVDGNPRYVVTNYLEHLGVRVDKIKQIHFYGGRRVSVLKGSDLRKSSDKILFAFNRRTAGQPRMEWGGRVNTNSRIDTLSAIAIYQDKPAPKLLVGPRDMYLAFEDGQRLTEIPYAPQEDIFKGTRIYVDGRFAGAVKRKTIADRFLAEGATPHNARFRLVDYLESLGVSFNGARAIDFIDGDDTIARVDAAWWRRHAAGIEFSLPRRSRGRIVTHLPSDAPLGPNSGELDSARVTAILVHQGVAPERTIHAAHRVEPDSPEERRDMEREVLD
jgi:hypothetical protein